MTATVARKDRPEELGGFAVDEAGFGNHADTVNLTWVSRPIPPRVIDADALFADLIRRYGP